MLKRTVTTLGVAVVGLVATAGAALADYPPDGQVKGKTIHTVAPNRAIAFTGSNTMVLLAVVAVLLVAGAALLYLSRRPRSSS
jgi:LPXTG-motif cell wall-anchored protein